MKNIVFVLFAFILGSCGPNPEKSDQLVNEGLMLAYYTKYEEAIEKYTEAIDYNPENFEAFYNRGNAKATLRRYEEALEDYTEAIRLHAKYADAYANRGQVRFYMNDKQGACADWRMAEQLGKPNIGDKLRGCN